MSDIDEYVSINYHTTYKNYQNLLQKWCNIFLHNRPTTQTICKIMKKFEETRVVPNIEGPVHRFARSAENIAIVSESVTEDTNVSTPRCPEQLGLS